MSLNPVFDVGNVVTEKRFDKLLCLFCQTLVTAPKEPAKPKRGWPKKDSADDFQDLIDVCHDHVKYNTGKYTALHNEISNKMKEQLKSERYCFHGGCRQTFDWDKVSISRKRKAQKELEKEIRKKQMCPTCVLPTGAGVFDYKKCLFYQENT